MIQKREIMMISIHGDPAAEIGSEEQGGQPIYIKDVCRLLSKNYKIDIFTRKKNESEEEIVELFPDVNVIRIKAGPVEFVPKGKIYLYLNEFFMNIVRWIEKNKKNYSLIHSHYWYSGSVALKLKDYFKIPMVHNCHSLGKVKYDVLKEAKPPFADMRLLEEELILKKAHAIIASTPQEVKNILDLYDVTGENIELIRAGVDERLFKPIEKTEAIEETGLDFENIILFVGRITKAKGLRILIKALKKLKTEFNKELKLLVVGGDISGVMHSEIESKEKKHIKKLIKESDLSDDVIFLGPVERERLPYYYSLADVCVIPSLYETFGLVAVEAMACGTPVIASKVGGLAHTVKNGYSGLHFVPGRSDNLAKKILEIITDSEKLREMGINARIRASREFGLERTVRQIRELYESLLF
jgi:glycosyltransferase involved in cell wall biosynthesis